VIISNLTNLYYPEVLSEFNARFAERGVHVLLFTIQSESDVDRVLSQVWQYRLDGVIAAARLEMADVREFERRGVPLVFYNRYLRERAVNAVCCDQVQSAYAIIDRLVERGHARFGVVGGPPDSVVGRERVQGCIERLRKHGIRGVPVVAGDYTYRGGRAAFAELWDAGAARPEAVICASDAMALGCIDAARVDRKVDVPREVSIVGFDGVEPGTWASYSLATVRQPVQEMAAAGVDLLLACVTDPGRAPEKRVFSGTLVAGGSARL
jgi:DNA-binding LacI/PurR family transcriptional regulator